MHLLARSSLGELPQAAGFAATVSLPMSGRVHLRVILDRRSGSGPDRVGRACTSPEASYTCLREPITSKTTLDGLTIAVVPRWEPFRGVRAGVGGGVTVARTDLQAFGTSGREAQVMNPNTAHPGLALLADASWQPVEELPVRLRFAFQRRWLFMAGCDSQKERYEAYCGTYPFDDLALGLAVAVPADGRR